MGQSNSTRNAENSYEGTASEHAKLLQPRIEDYVKFIENFSTVCTTCSADFVNMEIDSVLEFHQNSHRSAKNACKNLQNALHASGLSKNKIKKLTMLVEKDHSKIIAAAHAVSVAAMQDLGHTLSRQYALDIFRILATELRTKNPWRSLVKDVLMFGEILDPNNPTLDQQVKETLESIRASQENFEKYVLLVTDENQFLDPASSGARPKDIHDAADWAAAIRTLPRVYALLDSHVFPLMKSLRSRVDEKLRMRVDAR